MSAFAKAIVNGPGAEAGLEYIFANKMPKTIGRISLVHMLTLNGGVRSEYTVYKTGPQSYYLVSAGAFETHDHDYLFKLKPKDGSVDVQRVTTNTGVLVLAGPRSREVLQKITDTDLSNASFKWLTGKKINVGYATAEALRVNFVGELGYELHHPIEMQNYIFDEVMKAGAEFDIKPFGIRAMDSMRLEQSYRLIPREMSIEYSAMESALRRFVRLDKEGDFIGKDALTPWEKRGAENAFATFEVHGVTDADARGSEAIYKGGQLIGRTTSGGYGWRVGKSLALGMVKTGFADIGTEVEIEILGEMYKATVVEESPFDPTNVKLRA
jgi:dimethylglycine dehydrogenase